jgi:anaerobic selenocysteine-containing dehydrogenase
MHLESNPALPFQPGKACPGAQTAVQKLASPLRFSGPVRQSRGAAGNSRRLDWAEAIGAVASAFRSYQPDEIAFVLGLFPDHLNDLVQLLAQALGGASVLRFDPLGEFEGRVTLMDATQRLFGVSRIPYFDYRRTGVIFSFGSSFQESWLNSAVEAACYGGSPRDIFGADSYLVQFDSYRLAPAAWADEWIRIKPGSQAVLAQALAALVAGLKDSSSSTHPETLDLELAAAATGVPSEQLLRLARLFYQAERKLALPGSAALAGMDGPAAAESILTLNLLVENLGQPGGLFLAAEAPLYPWLTSRPSTVAEVQGLVERMLSGQIKALFVHGVDLVTNMPASFGLRQALERVEQVFSFASLPDQTSRLANYVLPDHLALEAWGYQRVLPGIDRPAVTALQPAVRPTHDTRASADVLLAAFRMAGGTNAAMPFKDELDFLKQSVFHLANRGGLYRATNAAAFWQLWQKHGGWWQSRSCLIPPVQVWPFEFQYGAGEAANTSGANEYPFHLLLYPDTVLDPKGFQYLSGLSKSIGELQVAIHPQTAQALGLQNGRQVKLASPAGQIQATVRLKSQLASDVLAMPWSVGSPVLEYGGHGAACNPLDLLGIEQNSSGNLALAGLRVQIAPI